MKVLIPVAAKASAQNAFTFATSLLLDPDRDTLVLVHGITHLTREPEVRQQLVEQLLHHEPAAPLRPDPATVESSGSLAAVPLPGDIHRDEAVQDCERRGEEAKGTPLSPRSVARAGRDAVKDEFKGSSLMERVNQQRESDGRLLLEGFARRARANFRTETLLHTMHSVSSLIAHVAAKYECELVVVGRRVVTPSRLPRAIQGVTERVIRQLGLTSRSIVEHAPCPVFVVQLDVQAATLQVVAEQRCVWRCVADGLRVHAAGRLQGVADGRGRWSLRRPFSPLKRLTSLPSIHTHTLSLLVLSYHMVVLLLLLHAIIFSLLLSTPELLPSLFSCTILT